MNKDKILSLTKYLSEVKSRFKDPIIPLKHKNRPVEYKEYLEREIRKTQATLDKLTGKV